MICCADGGGRNCPTVEVEEGYRVASTPNSRGTHQVVGQIAGKSVLIEILSGSLPAPLVSSRLVSSRAGGLLQSCKSRSALCICSMPISSLCVQPKVGSSHSKFDDKLYLSRDIEK